MEYLDISLLGLETVGMLVAESRDKKSIITFSEGESYGKGHFVFRELDSGKLIQRETFLSECSTGK